MRTCYPVLFSRQLLGLTHQPQEPVTKGSCSVLGWEGPGSRAPQLGVDHPADGSLFCEEAFQQQHLAEADHEQRDRLTNRPVRDSAIQVFGPGPVLGLPEPVMRLRVNHRLQSLVDGHTGGLHLGRKRRAVIVNLQKRRTGSSTHRANVIFNILGNFYWMLTMCLC